jgi:hypothetical protein
MKSTPSLVARSKKRIASLFLAGTAAVAALGAGPSLAQADRYERDRDGRFRDERVDFRVGERYGRSEERRVWIEPVYRTVCDKVWVEAVYRTEVQRVWCEPVYQTVCEKVWVPDRYEVRERVVNERGRRVIYRDRMLIERGHYIEQNRQVLVTAGHWDNVERRVCVSEGHWTTVERRECVTPGHWQTVAVRDHYEPRWNLGFSLNF